MRQVEQSKKIVFIFCYRYKLSITILIQFFPFLKCVYIFRHPLCELVETTNAHRTDKNEHKILVVKNEANVHLGELSANRKINVFIRVAV